MHSFALHTEEAVSNQPSLTIILLVLNLFGASSLTMYPSDEGKYAQRIVCQKALTSASTEVPARKLISSLIMAISMNCFTLQPVYSTLGILGELWQSILPCCEESILGLFLGIFQKRSNTSRMCRRCGEKEKRKEERKSKTKSASNQKKKINCQDLYVRRTQALRLSKSTKYRVHSIPIIWWVHHRLVFTVENGSSRERATWAGWT